VLGQAHAVIIPTGTGHATRVTELSIERAARNEAVFRDANERIKERRNELTNIAGRTPFLCECADPFCKGAIPLTLSEYEHVRQEPNTFVLEPGHPTAEADVIEQTERYVIVAKHGMSRRVAEETDPRR
jgi:hypothetical protein